MPLLRRERSFYRDVFMLMIPLIFQNLVTTSMAFADTFMVGMLGETQLSAVTVANTPFYIIMLMSFGIQSGASVLVAQYYGRNNYNAISRVAGVGFYISMLVTALLAVISFLFPTEFMGILTNNADLIAPGAEYMKIVGFSYFFSSISGLYCAVQRSTENPQVGAVVLSFSGLLNIFLNWVFIFGKLGAPALGISGAAIATLISRIVEVACCTAHMLLQKRLPISFAGMLCPGGVIFRDFVRFAIPVVINETLWSSGISIYTVIMGHMDNNTPILAAYTLASNLDKILAVMLFAAGGAAAVIIGKEIGRGNQDSIYASAVTLNVIALATGIVSGLLTVLVRLFIAEQYIFPLMGLSDAATGTALYMLTIIALLQPIRALNLANVVGIFRGGGDVHFALLADVGSMYLVSIPLTFITALILKLDIQLVYLCVTIEEIVKFFLCFFRLRSRKWIHNITRDEIA